MRSSEPKDIVSIDVVDRVEARGRRLDSGLESEGAEFLVLGLLLVERIQATKAYARFPGYDLLAFDPDRKTVCRIQVKSRWGTDYDKSFPIKNFDSDFVVHVALNRGFRYRKRVSADSGKRPPLVYVFPVDIVREAQHPTNKWGKVSLRAIPEYESYLDNWDQIRE
nr:hypothetical protein [Actinomycetota bacterium]